MLDVFGVHPCAPLGLLSVHGVRTFTDEVEIAMHSSYSSCAWSSNAPPPYAGGSSFSFEVKFDTHDVP